MTARRLAFLLIPAVAGCASLGRGPHPAPARAPLAALRASIDSMLEAPEFGNAHWGVLIVDPVRGDTLYSRNAGKLFMPASNMKLPTSAAALELLGPDYVYRTTVAARGPVADGALAGDLLVVGRGDPSVSDNMRGDAMLPLREIADSIAARGISRIAGRVVPGGDAFPDAVLGFGWSWDNLEFAYSAPVGALLFNEGFSRIAVYPGALAGDPAVVTSRPARTVPPLRASVTTVSPPAAVDGNERTPRATQIRVARDTLLGDVIVEGQVQLGDSAVINVTHRDPSAAYVAALIEALAERGIEVAGAATDTTHAADTLFTMTSPPLSEILAVVLKPSQNQVAEVVYKTLALETTGVGTADSARRVIERRLAAWGAEPGGYVVRDGSGLSRYNYLSPETVVRILDAMRLSRDFAAFYDAMPIAGVDGTLRARMRGTTAEGNVRAKTGFISQARSLSGYVTTADGRLLIFALLANNWTTPTRAIDDVQDAISVRLASVRLR